MIDWSALASIHATELDDMLRRRDFVCAGCGLSGDQHTASCPIQKLLYARRRMVPMVVI